MDSSWRKKMKNCEKNLPQDRSKSTSFLKTIIQCNSLYNVVFEIVRRSSFWRMVGTIFQKRVYSQTDTTNRHSHYSTNQLLRTTKNRSTFFWNIYLFFSYVKVAGAFTHLSLRVVLQILFLSLFPLCLSSVPWCPPFVFLRNWQALTE